MGKLSPYTLSIIGSSPPSLPHVPTLRELREINKTIPLPRNISNPPDQPPSPDSVRMKQRDGARYDHKFPLAYHGPSRLAWPESESVMQGEIPGEARPRAGKEIRMSGSEPYSIDEKGE